LVGAIAAGNCTILKPSELARASSALIYELITDNFDYRYIAVAQAVTMINLSFKQVGYRFNSKVGIPGSRAY